MMFRTLQCKFCHRVNVVPDHAWFELPENMDEDIPRHFRSKACSCFNRVLIARRVNL